MNKVKQHRYRNVLNLAFILSTISIFLVFRKQFSFLIESNSSILLLISASIGMLIMLISTIKELLKTKEDIILEEKESISRSIDMYNKQIERLNNELDNLNNI